MGRLSRVEGGADIGAPFRPLSGLAEYGAGCLVAMDLESGDVQPIEFDLAADTYDELLERWALLERENQYFNVQRIELSTLTHEGRTIYAYEITPRVFYYRTILVTTNMHGSEKYGGYVVYEIFRKLLTSGEHQALNALKNTRIVVVPCVNPDGYNLDQRTNNASATGGTDTDINRNFGQAANAYTYFPDAWTDYSDADPDRFKGSAEFSEPETQALVDLIDDYPDLTAVIDCHDLGTTPGSDDAVIHITTSMGPNLGQEAYFAGVMALDIDGGESFHVEDTNVSPRPGLTFYAQSLGLYGAVLEFNLSTYDLTDAATVAKLCNYYGNLIVAAGLKGNRAAEEVNKPKYILHRKRAQTNLSNTSTYTVIDSVTLTDIEVPFAGILIATYQIIAYPTDKSDALLYFAPYVGQNVSLWNPGDAGLRNGEERYLRVGVGTTSMRIPMGLQAIRQIYPTRKNSTDGNDLLTIGLQYKIENASAAPILYRYNCLVQLIPDGRGDAITIYDSTSTDNELVHPIDQ